MVGGLNLVMWLLRVQCHEHECHYCAPAEHGVEYQSELRVRRQGTLGFAHVLEGAEREHHVPAEADQVTGEIEQVFEHGATRR
jgi:regulator of sirC expression with transglutaminase-like and TPR domain